MQLHNSFLQDFLPIDDAIDHLQNLLKQRHWKVIMPFFNLQNYILEVFKIENSSRLAYFKMPSGCVRFFSSPILHKHPLLIGQARFSSRLRKMGEYSYKSSPLIARSVKYILLQKRPQNQWLAALSK